MLKNGLGNHQKELWTKMQIKYTNNCFFLFILYLSLIVGFVFNENLNTGAYPDWIHSNSTVIKDNALVEIKNKLRYPSKAKIESKRPKITSTNENIISYKNSALPPLKTPRGVNHSFNLEFIRGGS